jgi:hypothetical protein
LNSRITGLNASGSYHPSIYQGGSGITFDNPIGYRKIGGLVFMWHAFWSVSVSSPNNDILVVSVPFPVTSSRNIGSFGYNNSGKNYVPVIAANAGLSFCIKDTYGRTTDVKGSELTNFVGQWSIVYATNF